MKNLIHGWIGACAVTALVAQYLGGFSYITVIVAFVTGLVVTFVLNMVDPS